MNAHLKTIVIWLVVIAAVVIGYQIFSTAGAGRQPLHQSEFYGEVSAGNIKEITITGDEVGYEVKGRFKTPRSGPTGEIKTFSTYIVKDEDLMRTLRQSGVAIKAEKPKDGSFVSTLLMWSPMLLFLGVWIFFMRQMQSGATAPCRSASRRPS